jgi:hypothetical protein
MRTRDRMYSCCILKLCTAESLYDIWTNLPSLLIDTDCSHSLVKLNHATTPPSL